jgi:hypothetical protein
MLTTRLSLGLPLPERDQAEVYGPAELVVAPVFGDG